MLPNFEDMPLPPPGVEFLEAVVLTIPEVQVMMILFFFCKSLLSHLVNGFDA